MASAALPDGLSPRLATNRCEISGLAARVFVVSLASGAPKKLMLQVVYVQGLMKRIAAAKRPRTDPRTLPCLAPRMGGLKVGRRCVPAVPCWQNSAPHFSENPEGARVRDSTAWRPYLRQSGKGGVQARLSAVALRATDRIVGWTTTLRGSFVRQRRCSLRQRRFRRRSSSFRLRSHCYGETSWRDKAGIFPRSRLAGGQNSLPILVVHPTVRSVWRVKAGLMASQAVEESHARSTNQSFFRDQPPNGGPCS
jgi:hypothetical protein